MKHNLHLVIQAGNSPQHLTVSTIEVASPGGSATPLEPAQGQQPWQP